MLILTRRLKHTETFKRQQASPSKKSHPNFSKITDSGMPEVIPGNGCSLLTKGLFFSKRACLFKGTIKKLKIVDWKHIAKNLSCMPQNNEEKHERKPFIYLFTSNRKQYNFLDAHIIRIYSIIKEYIACKL